MGRVDSASVVLGVDQVMIGNREPLAMRLALVAMCAVGAVAILAILTYIWSSDTRSLAVFAFTAKTLLRSGQHRLILTAYGALGLAIIFESFFSLMFSRTFHGFRQAARRCGRWSFPPRSRCLSSFWRDTIISFTCPWRFGPTGSSASIILAIASGCSRESRSFCSAARSFRLRSSPRRSFCSSWVLPPASGPRSYVCCARSR